MKAPILVRFPLPEHGRRVGVHIDDTVYDVTEPVGISGSLAAQQRRSRG